MSSQDSKLEPAVSLTVYYLNHVRELAVKKGNFFYTKYFSLYLLLLYRKLPNLPE